MAHAPQCACSASMRMQHCRWQCRSAPETAHRPTLFMQDITLATQTTRLDPNEVECACAASALCSQVCTTLGLPRQYVGDLRAQLACQVVHDRLSLYKRIRAPALAHSHSHKTSFAGMSDAMQRCAVADTSQSHQALCWSASGAGKCCQKGRTSLHLVCTKSQSCGRELRAFAGNPRQ